MILLFKSNLAQIIQHGYLHISLWQKEAEEEIHTFLRRVNKSVADSWMMQFAPGKHENSCPNPTTKSPESANSADKILNISGFILDFGVMF